MVRIKRGAMPPLGAGWALFAAATVFFGASLSAHAGTLVLGQPQVAGSQYIFPIELQGDGGQVSALDFRVQFDPAVFLPVSAVAGNAALAANKMVSANYAAPGEYVVVMMGLNQTPVSSGQVATLVMERVGTESLVSSQVSIGNPTLASPDGAELPASGSAVSVPLGGKAATEGEASPDGDGDGGDTASESPTPPEAPQAPAPASGAGKAPATVGTPLQPGMQGMLAGVTDATGKPLASAASAGDSVSETSEKKGGLRMPIVLGSETPEAGTAARQAAAEAFNPATQRVRMDATERSEAPTGAADAAVAVDAKIESTRVENTPTPLTADAVEGGGSSEGESQGLVLGFAGVIVVLLLGAAVLLKKFSNR